LVVTAKICLSDSEAPAGVKVLQIQPYTAGGFAVLAPYHSARSGWLMKIPVDYTEKRMHVPRAEMTEYTATDRVKLSFHPDGFVQFSGENPKKIRSGRDEDGEPKGLGIAMQHTLYETITTGPTFGINVWGLGDFDSVAPRDLGDAYYFDPSDFDYEHGSLPGTCNALHVSVFLLPNRLLGRIELKGPRYNTVTLFHPGYNWRGGRITLRVIELPGQPIFMGVMVRRNQAFWDAPSGFTLHSPSDMHHSLMAMYPALLPGEPPDESLDWAPEPTAEEPSG
jgi:hypothetical protein